MDNVKYNRSIPLQSTRSIYWNFDVKPDNSKECITLLRVSNPDLIEKIVIQFSKYELCIKDKETMRSIDLKDHKPSYCHIHVILSEKYLDCNYCKTVYIARVANRKCGRLSEKYKEIEIVRDEYDRYEKYNEYCTYLEYLHVLEDAKKENMLRYGRKDHYKNLLKDTSFDKCRTIIDLDYFDDMFILPYKINDTKIVEDVWKSYVPKIESTIFVEVSISDFV
jgi:hypothetical protein